MTHQYAPESLASIAISQAASVGDTSTTTGLAIETVAELLSQSGFDTMATHLRDSWTTSTMSLAGDTTEDQDDRQLRQETRMLLSGVAFALVSR